MDWRGIVREAGKVLLALAALAAILGLSLWRFSQ
jgi:hypothetical protein